MKSYQLDGYNFLLRCCDDEQLRGGILADEMGLGKTGMSYACRIKLERLANILFFFSVQTLYLLVEISRRDPQMPILVVAPDGSMVNQWIRETSKFTQNFAVKVCTVSDVYELLLISLCSL